VPVEARRLTRLALGWTALAALVPIYPLYAVLFADTGLSGARISLLLLIWSVVSIAAEVPSGALADRFSRRWCLASAGVLQACGYLCWLGWPEFAGFATGFVLWGLGGSLVSGAFEALLYDGLAEVGAEDQFARILGWVTAVDLMVELPIAVAATLLFSAGGYQLVGWVSIGVCLAAAVLATRLPEASRRGTDEGDEGLGYVATLRVGIAAAARPGVLGVVVAAALVGGVDAVEEYYPLIAAGWGVPSGWVPMATVGISVAAAIGAATAAALGRRSSLTIAVSLGAGALALLAAWLVHDPIGLVGVSVFAGLHQATLVVSEARLQERVPGPTRATVTSVAQVGVELSALAVYVAWALGGLVVLAAMVLVLAAALPRAWRTSSRVRQGVQAPGAGR
jgi:hypothetical protein